MYKNLLFITFCLITVVTNSQTNIESIQSGVTFQWSDNQTAANQPATIESITVNSNVYFNFGIPSAYEMTQLGPGGHNQNNIRFNGGFTETTSSSPSWNTSALNAFQSLNLNHYFECNGNGENICDDYPAEETTMAQRQTLTYTNGIVASSSGIIAITERNANNCYHIEFFGFLEGSSVEESLGETFVNQTTTRWGFGGTGSPGNLGTPGALSSPPAGSDYWLSDRVIENGGTIGIAVFYLNDIAPNGSLITKATLTAATSDNGDGKMFILTLPDHDKDGMSDVDDLDDDNDGIKDIDESGGIDPSADHDVDGTPNYLDSDFCTLNASGICANLDFDSDGIPNHFDLDSDNDGITDVNESGGTDLNPLLYYDIRDGIAYGIIGKNEFTIGIPASAGTGTIPFSTDSDPNYNFLDLDSDNDGIPDNIEGQKTKSYISPSNSGGSILDMDDNGFDDNYAFYMIPEDTDLDGIADYIDSDSDNDGLLDIEENGMPNSLSGLDTDGDGLDDNFEGLNVNDATDVNDEINNPNASILPDTDGDLATSGDLDYRDLFNVNPPSQATLDFDGVDDYLFTPEFINGRNEVTIMAWVKSDSGNSTNMTIGGEDTGCRLWLVNGNRPAFTIKSVGNAPVTLTSNGINFNEWHHISGTYSSSTGKMKLYVDGELVGTGNVGSTGAPIENTALSNGYFEIGRTSKEVPNRLYFKGDIDEFRVFGVKLSDNLIQQMVYQQIEQVGGLVYGKVIPKPIEDIDTGEKIAWSSLLAYYPMTAIKNSTTEDHADGTHTLRLMNITTIQEQTAPMPYQSLIDGDWTNEATWLHGNVWDIEQVENNKEWSIVNIKSNVNSNSSHINLGLIIDDDKVFTINGDNKVENTWYLELNGSLDLQGDSQLIQTITSDLVTSSNGKLLRRQEGQASQFRYNYWSSPVGSLAVTNLTDNNGSVNTNNTSFSLNMLKHPNGNAFEFTNSYDEVGKISTYWTYTFINGMTYYDWASLNPSSLIEPGIAYTQKGTGTSDPEQQYLFEGKPNNGTVAISVTDVGGSGSVPSVSKTDFLMGNPYPSAIDLHKFIDDNVGVIDGTIQLWQHWSGSSHILNEYQGGYAQVNKLGSTRAYQFVGIEGDNNGNQDGTKTPTRYLPVGQGFITEIVNSGTVVFRNSQRVFIKESDANGGYNNGSVFFRNGSQEEDMYDETVISNDSIMQKIRLELNSVDGPSTRRELLLGFSAFTSDAYDYGYEAKNTANNDDDLSLVLDDQLMTMQAYGPITDDKSVQLSFTASGSYSYTISLTKTERIPMDMPIYIKDNLTSEYFDLTNGESYEFFSDQGVFEERFEIVFNNSSDDVLSVENETIEDVKMYYAMGRGKVVILNPNNIELSQLDVINILGQRVYSNSNMFSQPYSEYQLTNLNPGTYIVKLQTQTNQQLVKKIIVK